MKIRHILLALLVALAIAFMQPLVSFLGGLALLLGVGTLIFRDLSPASQDAVERRVLGWLRRTRAGAAPETDLLPSSRRSLPATASETGVPAERTRRGRAKVTVTSSVTPTPTLPDSTVGPSTDGGP